MILSSRHSVRRYVSQGGFVHSVYIHCTLDVSGSSMAGRSPGLQLYPFIPVVAMPSMNVRWAMKNRMITGAITRTLAAIR